MRIDDEGFHYPCVDAAYCVGCRHCENVCPSLGNRGGAPVLAAYAAKTRNNELLLASSSGGVFTELCLPVLANGGIGYGVAMDSDYRGCSFVRAERKKELAPMRGSKYLQADSRGVFKLVEADLKAGRTVLFSGTPCQANALVCFLGGKRDGLLVVDCICHGVPSPRLWAEHVAYLEASEGRRVTSVDFRCKEVSWREFGLKETVGKRVRFEPCNKSPYLQMFLHDYCLRPSCYECRAKSTRLADITIADFWGINRIAPSMSDEFGRSLAIVRTQRGTAAFDPATKNLDLLEVSYEEAVRGNSAEYKSATRPPERDLFFYDLDTLGYAGVAKKYGKPGKKEHLRRVARSALSRIGVLDLLHRLRGREQPSKGMSYGMLITFDDVDGD